MTNLPQCKASGSQETEVIHRNTFVQLNQSDVVIRYDIIVDVIGMNEDLGDIVMELGRVFHQFSVH